MRGVATASVHQRASQSPRARRPLRTTSESADRCRNDACFAVAEQASEGARPARLPLVRSDSDLRARLDYRNAMRKHERAASLKGRAAGVQSHTLGDSLVLVAQTAFARDCRASAKVRQVAGTSRHAVASQRAVELAGARGAGERRAAL
jgi:hypothetical protein